MSDKDRPGTEINWEGIVIVMIVGFMSWVMMCALGYTAWIWIT